MAGERGGIPFLWWGLWNGALIALGLVHQLAVHGAAAEGCWVDGVGLAPVGAGVVAAFVLGLDHGR